MSHPYRLQPPRAFWSRAVAAGFDAAELLDGGGPLLRADDRVMSAGSCFAANLVSHIEAAGFAYVRTEATNPILDGLDVQPYGYSRFSAAYGNVYSTRQLLQLIQRADGTFAPAEEYWIQDGEFVDPFRPGLRYRARSPSEFRALRDQHLQRTRTAVAQATVLVFTLGLTEAWRSRKDGAVFPVCPGTVAGAFDPAHHEFVNFSASEVTADLVAAIAALRAINPSLRVILTVSPVPLVATATTRHVVVASAAAKAVLRVAADEVVSAVPETAYFPAFEIVTGPQAPYASFSEDRREVSDDAINEVMRAFLAHCEAGAGAPTRDAPASSEFAQVASAIVGAAECEEQMLDRP